MIGTTVWIVEGLILLLCFNVQQRFCVELSWLGPAMTDFDMGIGINIICWILLSRRVETEFWCFFFFFFCMKVIVGLSYFCCYWAEMDRMWYRFWYNCCLISGRVEKLLWWWQFWECSLGVEDASISGIEILSRERDES